MARASSSSSNLVYNTLHVIQNKHECLIHHALAIGLVAYVPQCVESQPIIDFGVN